MSYIPVLAVSAQEACNRARLIAALPKSKYVLGAGGRNPGADSPFTAKIVDGEALLGSDCIGFVLWCWGIDRYQPVDGKYIDYPFYEGWINTDSLLMDANAKQIEFEIIEKPFPGCAVVYPSIWKNGKMVRMGHIGIVDSVPAEWPADWRKLSAKDQKALLSQVKVIDCAGAFTRKLKGRAVAFTNAVNWMTKPDGRFVRFKRQAKSSVSLASPIASTELTASPRLGDRTLRVGMKGSDVKELQRALNKAMHAGIAVDGDFGGETLRLLLAFQRYEGLVDDGVADPKTLSALKKISS